MEGGGAKSLDWMFLMLKIRMFEVAMNEILFEVKYGQKMREHDSKKFNIPA